MSSSFMIITKFEKTLLLRGQLSSPLKVKRGKFFIEVDGKELGTIYLSEIRINSSTPMRALEVECDTVSWHLDAALTESRLKLVPVVIHVQSEDREKSFTMYVENISSKILLSGNFSWPRKNGPISCKVTIENVFVDDAQINEPENTSSERYAYFKSSAECEFAIACAMNATKRCELLL